MCIITSLLPSNCKSFAGNLLAANRAGISAIVFGALNGFDQLAKPMFDLAVKDNYVSAKALSDECIVNKLLNFVYIQLRTVEDQYPKNIKITVMEV